MAKESGLSWTTFSVDDASNVQKAIKNDITSVQFATPRGVQEITGIDKAAIERLLLLADFSATMKGVFNDAVGQAHDVFKTVPSTSVARLITMVVSGNTLAPTCILTDYALERNEAGELNWTVPAALSSGTAPSWSP